MKIIKPFNKNIFDKVLLSFNKILGEDFVKDNLNEYNGGGNIFDDLDKAEMFIAVEYDFNIILDDSIMVNRINLLTIKKYAIVITKEIQKLWMN